MCVCGGGGGASCSGVCGEVDGVRYRHCLPSADPQQALQSSLLPSPHHHLFFALALKRVGTERVTCAVTLVTPWARRLFDHVRTPTRPPPVIIGFFAPLPFPPPSLPPSPPPSLLPPPSLPRLLCPTASRSRGPIPVRPLRHHPRALLCRVSPGPRVWFCVSPIPGQGG